jgi:hypothetical protein
MSSQGIVRSGYNSAEAEEKTRAFKQRHLNDVQNQANLHKFALPENWSEAKYVYSTK